MRTILVGLGAALLSWILLCLCVVAWLSWTRAGRFARDQRVMSEDYSAVRKEYGDPFELLDRGKRQQEFVAFPLISIITGVVVGLAGKVRPGWVAVVALFPLQIFLLAANSFAAWAFIRALVYFLLAFFCASWVQRMKVASTPKAASPPTA